MVRTILLILGLLVLTFVSGIVFLLLGMNIGGNYFTDFEFFGARGYEATGNLGFYFGLLIGIIVSVMLFRKSKRT